MKATASYREWLMSPAAWFLGCVFFRLTLDLSYGVFVSLDLWGDGFPYSVSWGRIAESWVALGGLIALTPHRFKRPSDFLALLLFLLCIIPITSYYCWAGGERVWFWALGFQYLLFCAFLFMMRGYGSFEVWRPRRGPQYAFGLIIVILVLCLFRILQAGVLDQIAFALEPELVYSRRAFVSSQVEVGIWGYLVSWAIKVAAIYLLIDGIVSRRWGRMLLAGAGCLMLFGLFAHKAIIFGAIVASLVLLAWPMLARGFSIAPVGLGILTLLMFVTVSVLDTYLFQSIFSRRLFFVPARLDFLYYDFFSGQTPLFFSNSFLRHFFEYPFDKPYPNVIGDFSGIGGKDTAANNGFLATGYMQLGWCGVVLYPIAAAILAGAVDVLGRRSPGFVAAVCFYPFAALFTSSDLPTAILTHGIGLLLLLLWLDHDSSNQNRFPKHEQGADRMAEALDR
jgi:hypothetical protein